jgi:hypothetical protein
MNKELQLDDLSMYLKNNINNTSLIYFSIGSALYTTGSDNIILDKNNHQFPPFLHKFKSDFPNFTIFIIVIDPYLHFPPYLVKNKNNNSLDNHSWIIGDYNNIYENIYDNIVVLSFRLNVKYLTNIDDDNIINYDITYIFNNLNNLIIEKQALFIFHDFSGQFYGELAYHFDKSIKNHNRIVYGLGSRFNSNCYIDLLNNDNKIIFQYDTYNENLTIFNPYNPLYHNKEYLNIIKNNHNKYKKFMIYVKDFKKIILDVLLVQFRKMYMKSLGKMTKINTTRFDIAIINDLSKIHCTELYQNKEYSILKDILYNSIILNCIHLFEIFNKQHFISHIQDILADSNIYNWYPYIKNILKYIK